MRVFMQQVTREMVLTLRHIRMIANSVLFFLMIMVFFPLTLPPDMTLLRMVLPGLVWIAVLLAFLLSSDCLFQQDYEDGVIEQWLVSGYVISLFVSAKVVVQWVLMLIPILLFIPVLAVLFGLNGHEAWIVMLSLVCGTPAILFLGALAAAFGTGLQQKGVFMALILLPLTIPVIIFGSGTLTAAMHGLPVGGYLAILLAMSVMAAGFIPFAVAGIIRISLTD
jgi:heme exporter protein B